MIKTLYTNGDSWTFGQELRDLDHDHLNYKFYNTWPWHLREHMRIPTVVNDALGGTSNYRILRRTLDYIQNYKGKHKELLVVVAWTTYERKEVPVEILRQHNNGHTKWQEYELEYVSVLMNHVPNVNTGDDMVDRAIADWHKTSTMLNSQKHNAKEFYNQQWILKQVCQSLDINLLQCYALDNPEFAGGTANPEWLDTIKPFPISFNRMLMEVEHTMNARCPGRHPNEEGHKYIAEQISRLLPFFKNYT